VEKAVVEEGRAVRGEDGIPDMICGFIRAA
jgi:hypothetical protein